MLLLDWMPAPAILVSSTGNDDDPQARVTAAVSLPGPRSANWPPPNCGAFPLRVGARLFLPGVSDVKL